MTDKTTPEVSDLEAKLNEALKSIEALSAKNKELLNEKKAARDAADQAESEREAAEEEKARSSNDLKSLEDKLKAKHARELAALSKENESFKGQLETLLVDNAISSALDAHNVLPQFKKAVTAMIKAEASLDGSEAIAGGLPLADYIKDFVSGDDGSVFVAAPANGGAANLTHGGTNQTTAHSFTKDNFGSKTAEWMMLAKTNPTLAKAIAEECGSTLGNNL